MRRKMIMLAVGTLSVIMITGRSFASQAIPETCLRYPVLLTLRNKSTASGFYLNFAHKELYFVTAKHVLFKKNAQGILVLKDSRATLLSYPSPVSLREPIEMELDLKKIYENNNIHVHPQRDVAIIKLTGKRENDDVVKLAEGVEKKEEFKGSILSAGMDSIKMYNEVVPANEVFIFGYPTSLGIENRFQIDHTRPLLRKGVIAGKNDKNKTIVLDCPVYYGNSGGPCVEVEQVDEKNRKFNLIGVVIEFVPFEEKWVNIPRGLVNSEVENSGYSIVEPIDSVLELIKEHSRAEE